MVSKIAKLIWLVIIFIIFLIGIFLLTIFPTVVYPKLVKSKLKLSVDEDGKPDTITWYWTHLPANSYYNFYMWNVTNIDEAWFLGEKISVFDIGPYAWREWESKTTTFSDDKKSVFYENDKAWDYDQSSSCHLCSYNDKIWIPNLSLLTTANLMEAAMKNNLSETQRLLTSVGTVLLGAYPFINVNMADALFNGYNDPLISLINSPLVKIIQKATGKPLFGFQVPDIPNIGYFPKYNHTNDVNYTVLTGYDDYNEIGSIQKWGQSDDLEWWNSDSANNISGTSDGSYWGGFIKKTTDLKTFQSFICRQLNLHYDSSSTIDDISSHIYKIDKKTFDTTEDKNDGYVVVNSVNKTFFPIWSQNHPRNKFGNSPFPPGIIEQKCFPGRRERLPFLALLSNPHFYDSDPEVLNTVIGSKPNPDKHNMGRFYIQPTVGSTLDALMRMQLSVAMFNDPNIMTLSSLKSAIVPGFWMEVEIKLKDYAKGYIKMNTTTIPLIAWIVGGILTFISVLMGFAIIYFLCRRNKKYF